MTRPTWSPRRSQPRVGTSDLRASETSQCPSIYVEPNRCDCEDVISKYCIFRGPARWPGRSWVDDENITVWGFASAVISRGMPKQLVYEIMMIMCALLYHIHNKSGWKRHISEDVSRILMHDISYLWSASRIPDHTSRISDELSRISHLAIEKSRIFPQKTYPEDISR